MALAACGGYRVVHVEVLRPAAVELPGDEITLLFADRKIVHAGDTLSARELEKILGVTRDDLVKYLYLGLHDGLRWGERRASVERLPSPPVTFVADSVIPPPANAGEVAAGREASHVLTVEYCTFRETAGRRVDLEGNTLLRLLDVATGAVLDSVTSDFLEATTEITSDDFPGSIREYFYQKGWSLATRLVPSWEPGERRIYTGHKLLSFGAYLLDEGDAGRALEAWSAGLHRRSSLATRSAVNVAYLLEREGEFEEAARLLEETLERARPSGRLAAYARERAEALKRRAGESERLAGQLQR
jgi:hypothetical protein